jgi:hypothetical protein
VLLMGRCACHDDAPRDLGCWGAAARRTYRGLRRVCVAVMRRGASACPTVRTRRQ